MCKSCGAKSCTDCGVAMFTLHFGASLVKQHLAKPDSKLQCAKCKQKTKSRDKRKDAPSCGE